MLWHPPPVLAQRSDHSNDRPVACFQCPSPEPGSPSANTNANAYTPYPLGLRAHSDRGDRPASSSDATVGAAVNDGGAIARSGWFLCHFSGFAIFRWLVHIARCERVAICGGVGISGSVSWRCDNVSLITDYCPDDSNGAAKPSDGMG